MRHTSRTLPHLLFPLEQRCVCVCLHVCILSLSLCSVLPRVPLPSFLRSFPPLVYARSLAQPKERNYKGAIDSFPHLERREKRTNRGDRGSIVLLRRHIINTPPSLLCTVYVYAPFHPRYQRLKIVAISPSISQRKLAIPPFSLS